MPEASEIRGLSNGSVSIGTAYTSMFIPLRKLMADFQKGYPHIVFHLTSSFRTELCQDLLERRLEFAIIEKREGRSNFKKPGETPMMAWVPSSSKLSKRKQLPLKALETEPYIKIHTGVDTDNKRALAMHHIHPDIQMYAKDSYTAFTMVEVGLGIALDEKINCTFQNNDITLLPVSPFRMVEISIACLNDLSPAAPRFLPLLKQAELLNQ